MFPYYFRFLVEVGIDLIRMAAIHTPSPLATALGLIAAFMIGEIAINIGLFAPEVILYGALAAVGTFATPSYELGLANRYIRFFLLISTAVLGLWGFIGGVIFSISFPGFYQILWCSLSLAFNSFRLAGNKVGYSQVSSTYPKYKAFYVKTY